MLKYILLICCLNAQSQDSKPLISAARFLNSALIQKDSLLLVKLLHPSLSYGHSNGWVENKQEVIENNVSGYLIYKNILVDSFQCQVSKKYAVIRFQAIHDVILKGKAIQLKLHVCQVWIKFHKHWVLLARQSTKID